MSSSRLFLIALLCAACARARHTAAPARLVQDPLASPGVVVLIFVRTDCPIANRYAPTIRALAEQYGKQGVRFVLVYPDADASAEAIAQHQGEFALPLEALRDPGHAWVARAGATVTPEVAVYDISHRLVYRGRIDDRFPEPGIALPQAHTHDLERVLDSLQRGESTPFWSTPAVGCPIPSL